MELQDLLIYAKTNKAAELHLTVNGPFELLVAGKLRQLNLTFVQVEYLESLILQHLGALAREQLRTTGRCEGNFEVEKVGKIRAIVETQKARFILPAAASSTQEAPQNAGSVRPPGAVPGLTDRLRDFFSRNR